MSMQNIDELRSNLTEYKQQLEQVESLLLLDHENAEYLELYNSLQEVIGLTEDLVRDAEEGAAQIAGLPAPALAPAQPVASTSAAGASVITSAPALQLPSVLPPQVAHQIRTAQQRAALLGQAPPAWAIGSKCQAVYSADGEWYDAVVEAVTSAGQFVVVFEEYGNKEEVQPAGVRPPPEVEEVYQGVQAPRRKKVEEEPGVVTEMPKWLEIKDTDDDKTRAKKKKLAKSYKSKMRFQQMDLKQKERQQSWLHFVQGKGSKKKTGFLTGRKKESMFKVPDAVGAKVGVIGSGQGKTDFRPPARHEFKVQDDE